VTGVLTCALPLLRLCLGHVRRRYDAAASLPGELRSPLLQKDDFSGIVRLCGFFRLHSADPYFSCAAVDSDSLSRGDLHLSICKQTSVIDCEFLRPDDCWYPPASCYHCSVADEAPASRQHANRGGHAHDIF